MPYQGIVRCQKQADSKQHIHRGIILHSQTLPNQLLVRLGISILTQQAILETGVVVKAEEGAAAAF